MCVVSMIGDHYSDKWKADAYQYTINHICEVSKAEFESLKKEVEEMKQLLIKAKIYDEQNNEPNCEMEDKIKLLKEVAEKLGVNLDEVFKTK